MSLWVVIFPADVVKSRVQIQGKGSLFMTMIEVFKNEGKKQTSFARYKLTTVLSFLRQVSKLCIKA